ncbi:MAG: Tc toxin subunit A, partial [Bryobacteraceae bacterium]
MPTTLAALHGTDPDARLKALQASLEQGIVPKELNGKKLEDFLRDFTPSPAGELQGLLGRVLNADEQNIFVGEYLKDSQNPEAFWTRVAADPRWAGRAEDLKLTVQFGALTNNHPPLVNAVKALPDIKQAPDLARLTEDDWTSLIKTQGVGVPDETPGADADEKIKNYARQIIGQIEAAFPTRFLAERLDTSSPVAKFLKSQFSYDLKTTYPEQFFKQNPIAAQELTPQDRDHLRKLQRVHHLTNSADATIALVEQKGLSSAYQIARMDSKIFADKSQDILSAEHANEVHQQARRTNAIALALLGEHGTSLNRTGLHALPKLEMQEVAAESGIPDWETLFGAFDLCACSECSSVHGPAAYFVDVLQFLKERGAQNALFERRPDLGDIELSCENTNTVLPYIDLVNEILENAVAPPPPFAPLTLAPALEDDLGETIATPALIAAFNPPLQSGARVEKLEDGKRWRVWDEEFAYSIVKENNALQIIARSRQTNGTNAERRAIPQYRNSAAYTELAQAVYPLSLPFDLHAEEANVFLRHLGLSRRDLIEALRSVPEPFDPN